MRVDPRERRFAALTALGGLVLGGGAHVFTPWVRGAGEASEAAAAHDVTFVVGAVLLGLATASAAMAVPARDPAVRLISALIGVLAGSLLAWAVDALLGEPTLQARGAVLVAPLTTAAVIFALTLTSLMRHRPVRESAHESHGP